ncbi:hypothetical protein M441DRAFT_437156 [Trichoderma asperellum CBS 433.97]|uniref:Uncharacterized protein n=1 Tax=Trichoderma asperellum (strain ATCC 204424 / CBS 433.97 / NBRC 101777) TaxID=1042311 RepID=A0A2T3Z3K6_TRIA4|nr:hypothetical protein M441DRAFT_437156 [Trichoderma asperellum CBS 433.97]PTB39382.1 hypothetical protein M441DRAFT_437156 [Trichoderma asperellum CBS 433.97]
MSTSPQPSAMSIQGHIFQIKTADVQTFYEIHQPTSTASKVIKITSDMWHVHVRSIIAVPSMWLFEPGKHRTQDCSLSSPFSFLRSPAVVSPRPKA